MATFISVDTQDLRNTVTKLEELIGRYKKGHGELYIKVDEMNREWKSSANLEYTAKIMALRAPFFEAMESDLRRYVSFLNAAAANYEENEANLKAEASGLGIR